jgi:ribosomal protein L37E
MGSFKRKNNREHNPCRDCGATHTNPMSSNLCPPCGVLTREHNEQERIKQERIEHQWREQNEAS